MRRLAIDPVRPELAHLVDAVDTLRRGGIVAYPTDTFYGLAVDPRSDAAVAKLFALKGRDPAAAIALIASDAAQARAAGTFGVGESRLAEKFWPGPLTIVVPGSAGLSKALAPDRGTLGVRVPAHDVARELAGLFGACITATSANRSGEAPAIDADAVAAAFPEGVDLILDAGRAPGGAPSTIVEVVDGRPTQLRAGAVPWERVLESVEW